MDYTIVLANIFVLKYIYPVVKLSLQARNVDPVLVQCSPIVFAGGPTLSQHWVNVPCWDHTIFNLSSTIR